ncbi:MAG: 16S rRNA (cytosine(967)-C(5))-methyltransferase RsmB [Saccharofermentanales bacterium]
MEKKVFFTAHSGKDIKIDQARAAAAGFVFTVCENQSYGNLALDDILESTRLSDIDKAFAGAIGKGTISYLANIDAIIAVQSAIAPDKLDKEVRAILRTAIWQIFFSVQIPDHSVCNESVRLADHYANSGAASYMNAVLRTIVRDKEFLNDKYIVNPVRFNLQCCMPSELAGYFKKWFGKERAIAISRALHETPSLSLRVNRLRTDRDGLRSSLLESGCEVLPSKFIPDALVIRTGGKNVSAPEAFAMGFFAVQDEAAMLTAIIADPRPGQTAVDLCAAPGGKACHLADLMDNSGRIYTFDLNASRLDMVRDNASRLGADIIRCRQSDAREVMAADLDGEPADIVLADVPCSGLGILRRKPDIMLNMTHERMIGLYPLQEAILDNAARLVKPGGTLLYSTCTVNPAENEERIQRFMDKNEGIFVFAGFQDLLPGRLTAIDPSLADGAAGGMITLYPDRHGCDGFFISKMRRIQ